MAGILLITKRIQSRPSGGRELLCKLNRDCLKDVYGEEFSILELDAEPLSDVRAILGAFQGYIDGLNSAVIARVVEKVRSSDSADVFLDGSNLGEVAAALRRQAPNVKIVTFFHNVESRFFLGSLKASRTPRAFVVFLVNYLAERKAVRYSEILIALTQRDSDLLHRVYGRSATYISPMALEDKLPQTRDVATETTVAPKERYILFVGGAFYANELGIAWFVKNVVPRIAIKTVVVGRGLEGLKPDLELSKKVKVIGGVQSLEEWYTNAHLVVAPIFDGSGMKTKVAEALMFGKKVVGTREAFTGYEDVAERAGWICSTADDFVDVINRMSRLALPRFDSDIRALFDKKYSFEAARDRLARILGQLN
jgi:glycosyltransferase involved in cell wall biosynthesis